MMTRGRQLRAACALLLAALGRAVDGVASPVIGVFAQPASLLAGEPQYLAASYVKFVEMAGGRVVPISYYASNASAAASNRPSSGTGHSVRPAFSMTSPSSSTSLRPASDATLAAPERMRS